MDEICVEVVKWILVEVECVIGVSEEEVYNIVKIFVENCLGCVVWCMGGI